VEVKVFGFGRFENFKVGVRVLEVGWKKKILDIKV
jgi:hypothetical protein